MDFACLGDLPKVGLNGDLKILAKLYHYFLLSYIFGSTF